MIPKSYKESPSCCIDCARVVLFENKKWTTEKICRVPNNELDFHPIKGYRKVPNYFGCFIQNRNGDCECFKPSLLARFLGLFGIKY
jgi:hypothetical protein